MTTSLQPALLMISGSTTALPDGYPQPLDMSIFRAPEHVLVHDAIATAAALTSSTGNDLCSISLPVPTNPNPQRVERHSPFAFLDPAANQLGPHLSDGRSTPIGTDPLIVRSYNTGSPALTSGSASQPFGLGVDFD